MLKLTQLGIKLDLSQIEKGHRLIDSIYEKIQNYNKEVEKSNKLLREQEKLRKILGVKVVNGKTIGLIEEQQ